MICRTARVAPEKADFRPALPLRSLPGSIGRTMDDKERLKARFERVRAHYRRHHDEIMADGSEWFDDAYSWDHEAGIILTPIETGLWADIRAENLILYPQYPVGRFFVDFGNPVWKVAVECDGARWHTDLERDQTRQQQIEALGWAVHRIGGRECLTDFEETEDEVGRPVVRAGAARVFIRDLKTRYPFLIRNGF